MRNLILISIICFFSVSQSAAQLKGLIWNMVVEMDDQLYPSYVWANANRAYLSKGNHLQYGPEYWGDSEGQIGIHVSLNALAQSTIKVVVESPEIMNTSSFEAVIPKNQSNIDIFPEIAYKWEVLEKNIQPRPANVQISVFVNDKLIEKQQKVITIRSKNECPYLFIHRSGNVHDMNFMYAAYVNENHPLISDEILPAIIKEGKIDQILGYQAGQDMVLKQVFAVWDYLRLKGIKYSSLNSYAPATKRKPFVISQFVRTLEGAYNNRQANCVDGTVLMASILYRMGIKPLIVTTPSHCYLGFYGDEEGKTTFFLETTMLGTKLDKETLEAMKKVTLTSSDVFYRLSLRNDNSFDTFVAAMLTGKNNYDKDKDKFIVNSEYYGISAKEEELDKVIQALQYQIYEVDKYRKEGLLPLNH